MGPPANASSGSRTRRRWAAALAEIKAETVKPAAILRSRSAGRGRSSWAMAGPAKPRLSG